MTLVSTVGGASGPAVRHALPADGRLARRRRARSRPTRRRRRAAGRARRRRRPRQGRRRATRRCTTRWRPPSTRSTRRSRDDVAAGRPRCKRARDAAAAGRDATTPMLARKGRASYLGERSVGHQDPGATTVALLLEAATRRRRARPTPIDIERHAKGVQRHDRRIGQPVDAAQDVGLVVVSHSRALAQRRRRAGGGDAARPRRCGSRWRPGSTRRRSAPTRSASWRRSSGPTARPASSS